MIYLKKLDEAGRKVLDVVREAASKVLRQDDSLSQLRSRLQDELSSEHMYAYGDAPYDEQGFPYVVDIFGDKDSGTVVYSVDDDYFSASYKRTQDEDGDGDGFDIGEPYKVDRAYVPAMSDVKESLNLERYISHRTRNAMPKDDFAGKGTSFPIQKPGDVRAAAAAIGRAGAGNHDAATLKSNIISIAKRKGFTKQLPKSWQEPLMQRESGLRLKDGDVEEIITIKECAFDEGGNGEIKLISPGSGSMGHYTEECLKEAASNKVFHKGLQMFMDHPSEDDMRRSGTGSVRNLAAVFTSDADYRENGKNGPGLYAKVRTYPDTRDFLNARSKDIGVSIAAAVKPSKTKIDGVPVVESIAKAISTDFVSMPGAGGSLVQMFESFRERPGQSRQEAAPTQESIDMEMKPEELQRLQESAAAVPQLKARLDRQDELLNRYRAKDVITEAMQDSGLPTRGQKRVIEAALSNIPMTDDKLDETKLRESVKTLITEELAYLQEAGYRPSVVKANGGTAPADGGDDVVLQESAKLLDSSIQSILGKGVK